MIELLSCRGREIYKQNLPSFLCVCGVFVWVCLLGVGRFPVLWLLFVAGFFSLEDNVPYCAI